MVSFWITTKVFSSISSEFSREIWSRRGQHRDSTNPTVDCPIIENWKLYSRENEGDQKEYWKIRKVFVFHPRRIVKFYKKIKDCKFEKNERSRFYKNSKICDLGKIKQYRIWEQIKKWESCWFSFQKNWQVRKSFDRDSPNMGKLDIMIWGFKKVIKIVFEHLTKNNKVKYFLSEQIKC